MPEVLLTDAARAVVHRIIDAGLGDNVAIVLLPDTRTDTLLGRIMDRSALATLPMTFLAHTPEGLKIYAFGIETLPQGWAYELAPISVPSFVESRDPFSALISSLFRVTLRQINRTPLHA